MTRRFCLFAAALLLAAFCAMSAPQWWSNPDLSHGLFMPVVFLFLLHESRSTTGRGIFVGSPAWRIAAFGALLAGLAAIAAGGLYAAALEWSHPLVGFVSAAGLSALLLGTLIMFASDNPRLVPFCWSSFLACALWVLCAPIPPGTYTRLTLTLQSWVSQYVVGTLHLLGIPADRHGNIIEMARATVGIEEACSGVRSLVSCVFAGLFFSGCLVRRPLSRLVLVVASVPLAIGMNFIRSLTLTLLANAGTDISGGWHDATGFAVLGVTAVLLGVLALGLARLESRKPVDRLTGGPVDQFTGLPVDPKSGQPASGSTGRLGMRPLAAALGLAVAIAAFFAVHTLRRAPGVDKPPPDLARILPETAAGWSVLPGSDLNRFSSMLQTDTFIQRTYVRGTPADGVQIKVYIAYWRPGQANPSLVATHTPDACWPGAGWTPVPVEPRRVAFRAEGRTLPEAEYRLFNNEAFPQHVWYWHIYDGAPIKYLDPLSPRNVLEIAARYGFRRAGDQMFIRISSNKPWADIEREPLVIGILSRLDPLGL